MHASQIHKFAMPVLILHYLILTCTQLLTIHCSQFLMPGFVDTHFHAPSFRGTGLGYDRPFTEWVPTFYVNPEIAFRNATFARQLSLEFVV